MTAPDQRFEERLRFFLARQWPDVYTQLRVDMTGLEARLQVANATDFEKRFGLPRARVDQLEDDTWYELARGHLFKLVCLEREIRKSTDPTFEFFQQEQNPLWETFAGPGGVGLTGVDLEGRPVRIDLNLIAAFSNAGITLSGPSSEHMPVAELMRTQNCVIVGSPKCNAATEAALDALFPEDPASVSFHWPDWPEGRAETRISRQGPHQIHYIDHRGRMLNVKDGSPEFPVGLLVVCRSPLETTANVTTIIAAGSTRYGTLQVVEDLLSGDVHVPQSHVKPNQPQVLILMAKDRGKRWYSVVAERHLSAKRAARRDSAHRAKQDGYAVPAIGVASKPEPVETTPPFIQSPPIRQPRATKTPQRPPRRPVGRSARPTTKPKLRGQAKDGKKRRAK